MCLGVVRGPQEQLLSKLFWKCVWSKKGLGGSRRVLGIPQTALLGIMGQGAGAGTPWARGRGRDPLGQGPGPGPPGAWGPLGPRCRIRMESVTTFCQASYLLSGRLPTVRQTTYCQAGFQPL